MLERMEGWLEGLFELPARRLFRTRLQPVELARAVGHAMEQQRLVGPHGPLAPNRYRVALHPQDYEPLAAWRAGLERELAANAEQRARERGWRWSGRVVVELVADEAQRPGRPAVAASFQDAVGAPDTVAPDGEALEHTAVLERPLVPTAPAAAGPSACLELEDGRLVALGAERVRLGRAGENDVVLDHPSVSRYHVSLYADGDGYRIVDLESHNGTRVNGVPVTERRLAAGDRVEIGGVLLHYRGRG